MATYVSAQPFVSSDWMDLTMTSGVQNVRYATLPNLTYNRLMTPIIHKTSSSLLNTSATTSLLSLIPTEQIKNSKDLQQWVVSRSGSLARVKPPNIAMMMKSGKSEANILVFIRKYIVTGSCTDVVALY